MKTFLRIAVIALAVTLLFSCSSRNKGSNGLHAEFDTVLVKRAANLIGLSFDTSKVKMMQSDLVINLRSYTEMRRRDIDNGVVPAIFFNPVISGVKPQVYNSPDWALPNGIERPGNAADIAFMKVTELASLIRDRKITSVELTEIYIDRLKRYGDTLHCVVTLTADHAREQAVKADMEIAAGNYRGPLHGIPYGVKDLLAYPGYLTTWGAAPYAGQVRDETATVIKKLEEAGAVMVAKLSMGSLAMGDLWHQGRTRNPWNPEQGSSGSSAGSASATAAGLVAFSIGTETLGSIVSPSTRCGTSGLRPTFGRVSRHGAMTLSWTMDKIGPICRSAEDCAFVLNAIRGVDGKDLTVIDNPFNYRTSADLKDFKIGYVKDYFDARYEGKDLDREVLRKLSGMGVKLQPVELDFSDIPVNSLRIILTAEAAAAFDDLTRSGRDSLLTGQGRGDWPNVFRASRFIPAVEYIQANRYRTLLMHRMDMIMKQYDVILTPSFGGVQLLATNLTGHPCIVIPSGFTAKGLPASISFIGNLFDEASIAMVAAAFQKVTDIDEQRPALFNK